MIYVHFRDEIKTTYNVFTGDKLSYRLLVGRAIFFTGENLSYQPLDWLVLCRPLARVACAPTAGVKSVNMPADWCMVFRVFVFLLLSFLHKIIQKFLKFVKVSKRGMEGKDLFYLKNVWLFV